MTITKRLVAIDDDTLKAARAELGTLTIKETVNTALKRVSDEHHDVLDRRLQVLARIPLADRQDAWR